MNNTIQDFKNAMRDHGITPPSHIKGDGQLHRFKNEGDTTANSWYILHLDGIAAGSFGCWKLGVSANWCSKSEQQFTPEERAKYREQCEQAKQQAELERKQRHKEAAQKANSILNRLTNHGFITHPYTVLKGDECLSGSNTIRCGQWDQRGWNNALIIPLINNKGDIVTIQAINEDGQKDFLAGGEKSGAFYPMTIGKLDPVKPVLIGEGVASTGACRTATGFQALAAMDAGNLLIVAKTIRKLAPDTKIILLADNDIKDDGKPNIGILKAIEAAKAVNGYVAIPELPNGTKCDFWDVYKAHGSESVRAIIDKAVLYSSTPEPIEQEQPAKPIFTPISELIKNRKSISWLIRDYLPLNSTCMVYGESGAGKSFLVLDMALSIAIGKQWAGQRTKQGAVFYVIGEGQSGIKARCQAWAIHHQISLENVPFYCTESAVLLPDKSNLLALMNGIDHWFKSIGKQPALIVFDTMARCFNGDENQAKDASAYIQAMDTIKQAFECCVLNVHHTGKDKTKGGRGSSAFKGAWDMEFSLSLLNDIRQLETTKAKETKEPANKFFTLETIATDWLDDDQEVIYSAVMVESVDHAPINNAPKISLKPNDEKALACLGKAINDNGIEPPQPIKELFKDSPYNIPNKVVNIDIWRKLAYEALTIDTSETTKDKQQAKRKAFNRISEKLDKSGLIRSYGDYAWIAKTA